MIHTGVFIIDGRCTNHDQREALFKELNAKIGPALYWIGIVKVSPQGSITTGGVKRKLPLP